MCKPIEEQILKNKLLYEDIFNSVEKKLTKKLAHFNSTEEKNNFLYNTVLSNLKQRYEQILISKKKYKCKNCGICCKFALSEFSPLELKNKADNGDNYAKQFVSIFTPYSCDIARKIYPDYVLLLEKQSLLEKTYFYRCNKVGEKNGESYCPDYESRPDICKDFPNNPLVYMPVNCGYQSWKDDFEVEAMYIKASVEIASFLLENKASIKNI